MVPALVYMLIRMTGFYRKALLDDANLCEGLNVHRGNVTYKAVADALGTAYQAPRDALQ